ncbi:MAG TPA: polyprenyl synthetase family protein [Bacteroidales bacterium]|nr:polyprenyl synthetase family protein [Bacteroidales bacterium]HPS74120.1 polyprenyl synthetase family protein [Bacteroidales bacterium]
MRSVMTLDEIKAPVEANIAEFEKKFRSSMKSSVPLLDTITRYIIRRKGKQIRPVFVFLTAGLHGGVTESTYTAASLIELLHTATLVHDDVVDESNLRRGFFSLNALWKNKIAVLVGDFLLSRGLLTALDNNEPGLLKIVSNAVKEMSEGELMQIEKARRLDIAEEIYFEIIRKKTASLIASCCACGTASAGAGEPMIRKMWEFGENVGIAFQIKDDIFDYDRSLAIGKPHGIDIRDQKMTLPLIYLLNHTSSSEKRWIINTVKNHNMEPERVNKIIQLVNESAGIEYARTKMTEYRDKAMIVLKGFPQGPYRESLENLVIFTTERNK